MKQLTSALSLVLLLVLAGCSESTPTSSAPETSTEPAIAESAAPEQTAEPVVLDASSDDAECSWIMGWDPWEPYQYMDVGNAVRGLDVEIVAAAASAVGCDIEYRRGDWLSLLEELKAGDIHLLAGATPTEDREAYAHFSSPYREETFQLFVRADNAEDFSGKSLSDLLEADFQVGVTAGYFYGESVAELEADPRYSDQFHAVDSGIMHVDRLLNHNIGGFLEDEFVAASLIRRQGLDDQIAGPVLEIGNTPVRVMFSKASVDEDWVDQFNQALESLRDSGRYSAIVSRYLPPDNSGAG